MIAVGKCIEMRAWSTGHYIITVEDIDKDGITGAYTCLNGKQASYSCGFFPWKDVKSIKSLEEERSFD